MDLRQDCRTRGAYAFSNGVSPTKDVARRLLSTLEVTEHVFLITRGRSYGLRSGALAVTRARALLVPPQDRGDVDIFRRDDVSGAVAIGRGVARVTLRDDASGTTHLLEALPASLVDEFLGWLPRLERLATTRDVTRWSTSAPSRTAPASAPARTATPVSARAAAWASAPIPDLGPLGPTRAASGWASERPPMNRVRPTTTGPEAARTTATASATAGPASARLRPGTNPSAPVQLLGGPPVLRWEDAEALAVVALVHLGFPDAMLTPPGPDGGIDVTARRAVAQVKFKQDRVPLTDVQALFGAASAEGSQAFFVSLNGYTAAATNFGERAGVALFTYAADGTVVAASKRAWVITVRATEALTDPAQFRGLTKQREAVEATAQEVDRLTARAKWLVEAGQRSLRSDRSRSGTKARECAIAEVGAALQKLDRSIDEQHQSRKERLLRDAASDMRTAARRLKVSPP